MSQHYGQTVEKIIRRNGYSISELARLINVNRRSVYNWFNQQHLKLEIIYRIGCALNYDFSIEFPNIFSPNDFIRNQASPPLTKADNNLIVAEQTDEEYWKTKYIELLEEYKDLLTEEIQNHTTLVPRMESNITPGTVQDAKSKHQKN